jgi:hypothetical protein
MMERDKAVRRAKRIVLRTDPKIYFNESSAVE